MPPRVVIDTNVFIAALLRAGGDDRTVLRACLQGKAQSLIGAAPFHEYEYEDVVSRPGLTKKCPLSRKDRGSNLIRAVEAGTKPNPLDMDSPTFEEGAAGMAFIEAVDGTIHQQRRVDVAGPHAHRTRQVWRCHAGQRS